MERTRVSADTVVVAVAVAITAFAVSGYGLLHASAVPAVATSPPSAPPIDTGPSGPRTWPPLGNGTSASPPAPFDLRLSATSDAAIYAPGQLVWINVTIANVGNTTENVTLVGCGLTFGLEDASGAVVYDYLSHVLCNDLARIIPLLPGQSVSATLSWNQLADNGTAVPAPASYTVVPYLSGGAEDTPQLVTSSIRIG